MPVNQRSRARPHSIKEIEARCFSSTPIPNPDAQQKPAARQPPLEPQEQPINDQQSRESIPKIKISLINRSTASTIKTCKAQPLPMKKNPTKWLTLAYITDKQNSTLTV